MKQFNLEEYLANPSRKVVTRSGNPVRILCTDAKVENFPIVAIIEIDENNEFVDIFQQNGESKLNTQSDRDLFFAPKIGEGWVNVYKMPDTYGLEASIIFGTKDEAEFYGVDNPNYIATTKINWEEDL